MPHFGNPLEPRLLLCCRSVHMVRVEGLALGYGFSLMSWCKIANGVPENPWRFRSLSILIALVMSFLLCLLCILLREISCVSFSAEVAESFARRGLLRTAPMHIDSAGTFMNVLSGNQVRSAPCLMRT